MNDELDVLDDTKLSEVFAVEVAGWRPEHFDFEYDGSVKACCIYHREDGSTIGSDRAPNFAADANAVLPFVSAYIDKELFSRRRLFWYEVARFASADSPGKQVYAHPDAIGLLIQRGELAKGFCIALIRAKRASK